MIGMQATSTVQTEKAPRYMKALVNHFSKKANAAYEADQGYIEFAFGRCDIHAQDEMLSFQLASGSEPELQQLKWVVEKHLVRFSQNDIPKLNWQS